MLLFFALSSFFLLLKVSLFFFFFFFSSRRRHTRYIGDWSSDVCSSDLGIVFTQRSDQILTRQQAGDVATVINDRKIVLRSRKQSIHRFLQGGISRESTKFAYHRAGNREPARDIFHLRQGCFLRRTDINKKRDEEQKWIPKQSDESENECKTLADVRSDLCSARIT